jgi:hypothetical protein
MPVVKTGRHEDQQPQKRQQQRKKHKIGSPAVYTPDGQLQEQPSPKIDLIA